MKNSFIKNFSYLIIYQLLIFLIPVLTTPYISRTLGKEYISIDSYILTIIQIFVPFVILDIPTFAKKELAKIEDRKQVFSTLFTIQLFLTSVITLIFLCYGSLQENKYGEYYYLYLFYLIGSSLDIAWYFIGIENLKKVVIRNSIVRISTMLLIFILVRNSSDYKLYILINGITLCIAQFITIYTAIKDLHGIDVNISDIKIYFKKIVLISAIPILSSIMLQIQKIMLNTYSSVLLVGDFSQAFKIYTIFFSLLGIFNSLLLPRSSRIYLNGNFYSFKKFLNTSLEVMTILTLPIITLILIFSKDIVNILLGRNYYNSIFIINLLAPTLLLISINNVIGTQGLLVMNEYKKYTSSLFIGTISSFLLSIFLFFSGCTSITIPISYFIGMFITNICGVIEIKNIINLKHFFKYFFKYFLFNYLIYYIIKNTSVFFRNSYLNYVLYSVVLSAICYTFYILAIYLDKKLSINNIIRRQFNEFRKYKK
ncbi:MULTISPECIES: oligosaccharide flippase family protein [Enterococcus]|nr:oligosaccharide flippase family protein [Enterococcus hirae]MEB7518733.1 oligosaccharide flippase family protein [Enterococcus hirae]